MTIMIVVKIQTSRIKRQDSNLGFVKPPVEQEFVGAPILKITKKEAQNLQDLIKGLV